MRLRFFLVTTLFCLRVPGFAKDPTLKDAVVFEIRRQVALDPSKPEPKDFFINAGAELGLKPDMVVVVTRRHALYDSYQNRSPGDLIVPVGQLRIIHVQKDLSVARMEKMLDRGSLPALELDAIMIGDRLDLSTAKMIRTKSAEANEVPAAPEPPAQESPTPDTSTEKSPSVAQAFETLSQ
jgi:hypothetical protein